MRSSAIVLILVAVLVVGCATTENEYSGPTGKFANGMVVYQREIGYLTDNGIPIFCNDFIDDTPIMQVALAARWKNEETGLVVKNGSTVYFYTYDDLDKNMTQIKRLTLARDWTYENMNITFKADTDLQFYENNRLRSGVLAEAMEHPVLRQVYMSEGTKVEWYENGNYKQFTMRDNYTNPSNNLIIKAGKPILSYETGGFKRFVLAADWAHPNGSFTLAADTTVEYHENQTISVCTFAMDTPLSQEIILKAGTEAAFTDTGRLIRGTFRKRWTDAGTNTMYEADKEYIFEQ